MLTGLAQVLGENQLERIELRENLRTEDCVCPGEGQLVRVLRGYLRQLPKLPAKTIIMENRRWNLPTPVMVYANPKNQIPAHLL